MKEFVMTIFIFVCLVFLLCSCQISKREAKTDERDTIFISYYPYIFDTNIRISCASMAKESSEIGLDSIIPIRKDYFDKMKLYIKNQQPIQNTDGCDTRIYVRNGTSELCMGGFISCLCDINDNDLEEDLECTYLIKWKSGYFNCFNKNELTNDKSIEKFGIPDDYNYDDNNDSPEDHNKVTKIKSIRKIALISQ